MNAKTTGHRFGWQRAWPLWILAAFFGVIFIVNGIMVYLATSSFTGLTTEQAYEKGRTFNTELARREAQNKLGWTATLKAVPQQAGDRHLIRLDLIIKQADQQPLGDATVEMLLVRPTHDGYDKKVTLTEAQSGTWQAHVELPLPGQWEVRAVIKTGAGEFRLVERITVE